MTTGVIKSLQRQRGFGFVTADDGTEYFFHRSGSIAVFEDLIEGAEVTFDTEPSERGPRAVSVALAAARAAEQVPGAAGI